VQADSVGEHAGQKREVVTQRADGLPPEETQSQSMALEQASEIVGREIVDVAMRLPVMALAPVRLQLAHVVHIGNDHDEQSSCTQRCDGGCQQQEDPLEPRSHGVLAPLVAGDLGVDRLEEVVAGRERIFPVRRLTSNGLVAWGEVLKAGFEGYVAKDEASAYVGGVTKSWLKVKVPGWTDPEDRWKRVRIERET